MARSNRSRLASLFPQAQANPIRRSEALSYFFSLSTQEPFNFIEHKKNIYGTKNKMSNVPVDKCALLDQLKGASAHRQSCFQKGSEQ